MSDKDYEELVFLLERLEKLIAKHNELQKGDKPFLSLPMFMMKFVTG